MRIARSTLVLGLLLLVAAGCGGDADDDKDSNTGAQRSAGSAEEARTVEAELKVRLEHVGDKSSGAGIAIPTDIACTKSIPATCHDEYECPATTSEDEGICAWLATNAARDLLLDAPPEGQMCTQQYGGDEVATVTGTLDGERVDVTFVRTDGCEISRFDAAAPLWTREAGTTRDGATRAPATSAMCVAEDPDKPVSSDNPPVPCEDTVVEPDVITDPPEAFDR